MGLYAPDALGAQEETIRHPKRLTLSLAGLALAALALLCAPGVALASGWSIQQAPSPVGAVDSGLSAVSCVSATACTAVGTYSDTAGPQSTPMALAERWNGRKWSLQQVAPLDVGYSDLSGVSCASPRACIAVGDYSSNTGTEFTFGESWDGRKWSVQRTAKARPFSNLNAISCTSPRACTAVGSFPNTGGTVFAFAERWNGRKWSIQTVPRLAATASSELNAVSCTSASACTAVGDYGRHTRGSTLAEAWNGRRWSIERSPNPAGAGDTELDGLDCTSSRACIATGFSGTSKLATVRERWNGTTWSLQRTPKSGGDLTAVSCTSPRACTAVGDNKRSRATAERWNGRRWSIKPAPTPTGATFSSLSGVSCISNRECIAVGDDGQDVVTMTPGGESTTPYSQPLAERYLG